MPAPGMMNSGVPTVRSFSRSSKSTGAAVSGSPARAGAAGDWTGAASPSWSLMKPANPWTVGWSKIRELGMRTPTNSVTRRLRNSTPDKESIPDSNKGESTASSAESTTSRAMSRMTARTEATRSSGDRPAKAEISTWPPSPPALADMFRRASASNSARKRGTSWYALRKYFTQLTGTAPTRRSAPARTVPMMDMPCTVPSAPTPMAFARCRVFFCTAMPTSAHGPHWMDQVRRNSCAVQ
mmetsp:Transcript_61668/g.143476  ORF Transcript_61668/g.143476 Transcript_61668/m.143476 type:complete len:240 (-) Transcript_61668:1099-1818(-)